MKKNITVNLWDHYDKVRLAAQRIALIQRALLFDDAMFAHQIEDFILKFGDDGVFNLKAFDGFTYHSSGHIRIQFEWDDEKKNVIPEILFEVS